ncbi:hypothetical protein MWU75_00330 [Ornithinimicrobium sp. F0845]|uniref:hypothetical protein n=1 Tax=Ornithinimicrobium sp. F0845 TaxID=2926412 RepID=UPI001FF20261|nr:hypothetical protein [Ornithinimicrobium sp. F0845]MCK0110593.1 hypothetical protein [Ornithinimicrobium sp. F0845]
MTLELLGGVRIVVELGEPHVVTLSLHRARGELDGPPATRPQGSPATVAMDVPGGGLVIRDVPATHQRSREEGQVAGAGQFRVTVPPAMVGEYVDVLAGLPLDTRPWAVPVAGVRLWRGRVNDDGWALVELLGDEERRWGAEMPVVARVDLGLGQH